MPLCELRTVTGNLTVVEAVQVFRAQLEVLLSRPEVVEKVLTQERRHCSDDRIEVSLYEAAFSPRLAELPVLLVGGHLLCKVRVVRLGWTCRWAVAIRLAELQRGLHVELLAAEVVGIVQAVRDVSEDGTVTCNWYSSAVVASVQALLLELHQKVALHFAKLKRTQKEVYTVAAEGVLQPFCGTNISKESLQATTRALASP